MTCDKKTAAKSFKAFVRASGDVDTLVDLGSDVGLNADDIRSVLSQGTYAADVQADIDQARAYGISGVPFFVIDGRYGISGAQSPDSFAAGLTQAAGDRVAPL